MSYNLQRDGSRNEEDLIGIESVITNDARAGVSHVTDKQPDESENSEVEKNPNQRQTDEIVLDYISGQRNKSFFLRNFSTVSKGGLRSSIFTLFSSAIGAGILSLPKVLSEYGVVLGTVSLLIFAMVSYRMHTIVWELTEYSKRRSYANVFALLFGKV